VSHGNALDNSYSVGKLTPHQHTRVLRRRTDTGSRTRTSSSTTHYEIEPPAVPGHQPPPGSTQTSPGPGTILPGAPNPRRAFGHVHRPKGEGGLGTTMGGPWKYLPGHRHHASPGVRLRLGRHCTSHSAWADIPRTHARAYPHTRDLATQLTGTARASNNRPEANPPIALTRLDTQCNHNRGDTGDDTQSTSTGHSRRMGLAYPS
jgi:hypothetical protein